MSRDPIAPKVAPAWPDLKTHASIRSYSPVTARGSSPSRAGNTLSRPWWLPRPTPVSPSSVSTSTIGTAVSPEAT